jgi:hypothetical protein
MTRNRVLIFLALAFVVLIFVMQKKVPPLSQNNVPMGTPVASSSLTDQHRDVMDQNKSPLSKVPSGASFVNRPSPDWKNRLELSLKAQGGENLKEIKIEREKSLIWIKDEQALMVESVLVSLTNQQDSHSSFRALVDSQTGKILESWDRTLFDPATSKEGFRFKLDPRYSN